MISYMTDKNNKIIIIIKDLISIDEKSIIGSNKAEGIDLSLVNIYCIEEEQTKTVDEKIIVLERGDTLNITNIVNKKDIFILENVRKNRNILLSNCDWTQIPNSPLPESKVFEWAAYRQALRDFPSAVNLSNIVYPTKPE